METTARADQLIKEINAGGAWEWANNAATKGMIAQLRHDLDQSFTPFMKRWFCEEPAKLKKNLSKHVLVVELQAMTDDVFKKKVETLARQCEVAVKRHQVCS